MVDEVVENMHAEPSPEQIRARRLYREMGLSDEEYERIRVILGREPNYVETGVFSVMWSEHCSYKSSKRVLRLLSSAGHPRVLQGPGENAGVIDIGDGLGLAFKMESHNHPSAIEPFQGAATGVGGIIRDVFTMGARPIALLNSLRFGSLDDDRNRYLFGHAVAGIAAYGNCIGIPTVGGEVVFDSSYTCNPLVNAMCVGFMRQDRIARGVASGVGNPVATRRREDRSRWHPRRDLRLGRGSPQPRALGSASRRSLHGEIAAGSLPGAAGRRIWWWAFRTWARQG